MQQFVSLHTSVLQGFRKARISLTHATHGKSLCIMQALSASERDSLGACTWQTITALMHFLVGGCFDAVTVECPEGVTLLQQSLSACWAQAALPCPTQATAANLVSYAQVYSWLGVEPPRGVLLHGPPGCGKTALANAIANQCGVPFLRVSAPEIVSGMSGMTIHLSCS